MARSATALSLRRPPGHELQIPDMLGQATRKSASQAVLVVYASSEYTQHPEVTSSQEENSQAGQHAVFKSRSHAPDSAGTSIGIEYASQVATAGVPNDAWLASSSQGLSSQTSPQPPHLAGHQPATS